jgi:hypothetical protein
MRQRPVVAREVGAREIGVPAAAQLTVRHEAAGAAGAVGAQGREPVGERRCTADLLGRFAGRVDRLISPVVVSASCQQGKVRLRLAVALSSNGQQSRQARDDLVAERIRQLQSILDRARERGEQALDVFGMLDHILAPMYVRILLGTGPLTPDDADGLVHRLL